MAAKVARELGRAPTPEDVECWLDEHCGTARTRRTYVAVLVELAAFGALEVCSLDGVVRPKVPRAKARPLPMDVARRLVHDADRPLRTQMALALYAGLRRAEIAGLCAEDIDHAGRVLTVHGKGDVWRRVPVSSVLADELAAVPVRSGRLWEVAPNTLGQRMCRWMRQHGVPSGGPHRLRATFATELVEAGVDVHTVAELLGHVDLTSFAHYYTPGMSRMRRAVEAIAA